MSKSETCGGHNEQYCSLGCRVMQCGINVAFQINLLSLGTLKRNAACSIESISTSLSDQCLCIFFSSRTANTKKACTATTITIQHMYAHNWVLKILITFTLRILLFRDVSPVTGSLKDGFKSPRPLMAETTLWIP